MKAQYIDLHTKSIYPVEIVIAEGKILSITKIDEVQSNYILPGFIDAHIHIESSMLIPSQFARIATGHGTVATVSDPHEIANVLGMEGVEFMIDNANKVPLKFYFGAPSCVPPTSFETSGAVLDSSKIKELLQRKEIKYLAEMMNYPGVLHHEKEVMRKLQYAKDANKPIDGHAPGLTGKDADQYINAGISTDHECFTYQEGKYKIDRGMKIIIREGSAAKNYEALSPLFDYKPDLLMFGSDDKHPDDLLEGHINLLVRRAVADGYDLYDVLRAACIHPVQHYGLDVGLLREGDWADFIVIDNLKDFTVKETYINGQLTHKSGNCIFPEVVTEPINNFNCNYKESFDFELEAKGNKARVIKAIDGELITGVLIADIISSEGKVVNDTQQDILTISVINRYEDAMPSLALINGFGLQRGAIASCVGHDTHNIIAVGCDPVSIAKAVNLIIKHRGGISAVDQNNELVLPLEYAGIMSGDKAEKVGLEYAAIDRFVKDDLGSKLTAPFMSLSFMALLVIPDLKLSDKGLFSGKEFKFVDLWL